MNDSKEITWVTDENGNKCSDAYFGTIEKAQAALSSLTGCKNCVNCSDCSGCSRCSYCFGCSGCSGCSDCSRCSYCSDCSYCSVCSDCSDCSDCSYCSVCSVCSDCSDCSVCSDCSDCSDCSYCSDCSDCSDCSYCSVCSDCSEASGGFARPTIPKLENIHSAVLSAVTQVGSLDMGSWHTCNTTHCRAGWIVHLAGDEGYALEKFHNTALAAQLIYKASGYEINPCRFYDGNDDAMSDMKRLADEEARK